MIIFCRRLLFQVYSNYRHVEFTFGDNQPGKSASVPHVRDPAIAGIREAEEAGAARSPG